MGGKLGKSGWNGEYRDLVLPQSSKRGMAGNDDAALEAVVRPVER